MDQAMEQAVRAELMRAQLNEITEHHIYTRLAERARSRGEAENARILEGIGRDEKSHYELLKTFTQADVRPDRGRITRFTLLARALGVSFALRLMERGEGQAQVNYANYADTLPAVAALADDEEVHEQALIGMLDDERLTYASSVVLGLNDALVELTGALAGFTLALADTKIISLAGLVTGISAAFSMAASDYLSSKAEGDERASKSAVYTGVAYLITVILLILPFLLLTSKIASLVITLATAVLIIFLFNYYVSVAKELDFKRRFLEMTLISLGVAAFSFFIGFILKQVLGVDA